MRALVQMEHVSIAHTSGAACARSHAACVTQFSTGRDCGPQPGVGDPLDSKVTENNLSTLARYSGASKTECMESREKMNKTGGNCYIAGGF